MKMAQDPMARASPSFCRESKGKVHVLVLPDRLWTDDAGGGAGRVEKKTKIKVAD